MILIAVFRQLSIQKKYIGNGRCDLFDDLSTLRDEGIIGTLFMFIAVLSHPKQTNYGRN